MSNLLFNIHAKHCRLLLVNFGKLSSNYLLYSNYLPCSNYLPVSNCTSVAQQCQGYIHIIVRIVAFVAWRGESFIGTILKLIQMNLVL